MQSLWAASRLGLLLLLLLLSSQARPWPFGQLLLRRSHKNKWGRKYGQLAADFAHHFPDKFGSWSSPTFIKAKAIMPPNASTKKGTQLFWEVTYIIWGTQPKKGSRNGHCGCSCGRAEKFSIGQYVNKGLAVSLPAVTAWMTKAQRI